MSLGPTALSAGAVAVGPGSARPAPPAASGQPGRRYLIRGGAVLSNDASVGDFTVADVLVEGKKILSIGPRVDAGDAEVIDAAGRVVMPGFIDTHHHHFETTLRSHLPNGLLTGDGLPAGTANYMADVMGRLMPAYRPDDVQIAELFGALSQLDAGVTTSLDLSQIHHSREHTEAALAGLAESGQRVAFAFSESASNKGFEGEARRIRSRHFASDDQLMTLVMGGELMPPGSYERAWTLARDLDLPLVSHVVPSMAPALAKVARDGMLSRRSLLVHMNGIDNATWKIVAASGAGVSLSVPIEMSMRHGMPVILKVLALGIEPSLSSDVECTMAADSFTQMRSAFTLQRMLASEAAIAGAADAPRLLTSRDVIRYATVRGAEHLWLGDKVGSLAPGKQADIVLLDATALNVAPLNNVPGAVVTLMDRSNVETVIVAGKVRKWRGRLTDFDRPGLT